MATSDKPLSQLDGGPQPAYGTSVWSILQNGLDTNPNHAALISMHQPPTHLSSLVGPAAAPSPIHPPALLRAPDERLLTWSYAQMRRGAARLAAALARRGVPTHSTALTLIPQSAEWALLLWVAALRCLTVISQVPQALRLEDKLAELRACFATMRPALVLVEDEEAAWVVDNFRAESDGERKAGPFLGLCLSRMSEPRDGWVSLVDVAEMGFSEGESAVDVSAVDDRPDRVAHIYFTSGSSGTPKGIPKTTRNLAASTATMRQGPPGSVVGVVLGGNFAAMASRVPYILWNNGNTVVLPSGDFSWGAVVRAIEICRVTDISMMRTHLGMLSEHKDFSLEKVASLRRVFLSGELITEEFVSKAREVLPGAVVSSRYGMSEVIGLFGWPGGDIPDPLPSHDGVVSCGRVMPGARIRIVNEDGAIVPCGTPGEMHVGSDGTIDRYIHMGPDKNGDSEDAFYDDEFGRWLRTGDIAVLDEAGCVYVVGRKRELIKNVTGILHPHMIESCLGAAFNVQTRVIGLPSPMNGEVPYPIVERLPEGVSEGDMKEYFINAVGSSYCLGTILTLEQLGMRDWPMTTTGKVLKRELECAALEYVRKHPQLQLAAYAVKSN